MTTPLIILLMVFVSIFSFLLGYLLALSFSGFCTRSYDCLAPSDMIGNHTVEQLAQRYKPIIYQQTAFNPPPYKILYEFAESPIHYILIYRIFWKNEIVPNPLLHVLYAFYRLIYYGSVQDIEFLELFLDKNTLAIEELHYETLGNKSSKNVSEHEFVSLKKKDKNSFFRVSSTSTEAITLVFEDTHPILQVVSWNHLLDTIGVPQGKKYDVPLFVLDRRTFRRFKFCRRSSGYLKTNHHPIVTRAAAFFLAFIFAAIPAIVYFAINA